MSENQITPDAMMKTYWRGNEEFADFYNAVLYDGEPVIRPEDLSELDSDSSIVMEHRKDALSLKRARDMIKVHKKTGASPVLLCMETQTFICYSMPLRMMGYEYISYHKKYTDNARKYKRDNTLTGHEHLSRMKRTDRFPPVVSIVVYYGLEPWDGPTTLRDMLDIPPDMVPFVRDYGISLIEARSCDLKLHHPNNIHLFHMLRIALNQDLTGPQAKLLLTEYADAHKPEKIVLMTLSSVISTKINYNKYKEEDVTVKTIFDDMFMEWKAEGKAEGRAEGKAEGKAEGRAEGKAEGKAEGRAEEIINIYREEGYSDQFILEKLQSKLNVAADAAKEFLLHYGKQTA